MLAVADVAGDCWRLLAVALTRKGEAGGDGLGDGDSTSGGGGKLMTAEERSTGAVSVRVYKEYLAAAGPAGVLLGLVGLFFVSNFSVQLQQW